MPAWAAAAAVVAGGEMIIFSYTYIEVKNFDINHYIEYNIGIYVYRMFASQASGAICSICIASDPPGPKKIQVSPK
jgi:hypothetical protein